MTDEAKLTREHKMAAAHIVRNALDADGHTRGARDQPVDYSAEVADLAEWGMAVRAHEDDPRWPGWRLTEHGRAVMGWADLGG